ncbi:MAG: hypothetical protein AAF560_17150 [Acidobacteriota bacterium]
MTTVDHTRAPRPWAHALNLVGGVCLVGLAVAGVMIVMDLGRTDLGQLNIFTYLYLSYEPTHLLLLLLLTVLLARWLPRQTETPAWAEWIERWPQRSPKLWLAGLAAGVLLVAWAGAHLVYQSFPFSMDEHTVLFQAKILAAGHFTAPVPEEWRDLGKALAPVFTSYLPESGSWVSNYLPLYATLLVPFVWLGEPALLNPLLAAATLFVLAAIARRLWPEERDAPVVCVLLLAASPQFLITAMSGYSMPAHLFFNLLWLWLYVRDDRLGWLLAPWVGLVAMGLHAFVPHALFAIPFLLRIVLRRRWLWAAYFASVYLLASALWIACQRFVNPTTDSFVTSHFGLPGAMEFLNLAANAAQIVAWQPLALSILVGLTLLRWRGQPPLIHDLAWSFLLSLAFYLSLVTGAWQGHGWGARYTFAALGNLVLLAVPGWRLFTEALDRSRAQTLLALSVGFALLAQLPLRASQVSEVIRPFAKTQEYVASLPEPLVVVPAGAVWYGQDIARNDPFLTNSPKMLLLHRLSRPQMLGLQERGPVRVLTAEELVELGMFPTRPRPRPR